MQCARVIISLPCTVFSMTFQATEFLFTINNYTNDDLQRVRSAVSNSWGCNYLCFGLEIAPSTGTPHIQGYLQVDHRMRASTVNRKLGNRGRLQRATASLEQNKKYTAKTREGDSTPNEIWEEYGEARLVSQTPKRKRDDYDSLINLLSEGGSIKEAIMKFPDLCVKHLGNVTKIRELLLRNNDITSYCGPFLWSTPIGFSPTDRWNRCLWLKGPSGIGKTQFACSFFSRPLFVRHIDQLRKFNAADHGGIIFDDMNFLHWPRESQITLLDCDMPTAVHVRYTIVEIPAFTKRIFTSNVDIFDMTQRAISRRVHRVNFN